ATFPPSTHTHEYSSLTGLPTLFTESQANGKYLLRTTDTFIGSLTVINPNLGAGIISRSGLNTPNAEHGGILFQSDRTDRFSGVVGFRQSNSSEVGLNFYTSPNTAPIPTMSLTAYGDLKV